MVKVEWTKQAIEDVFHIQENFRNTSQSFSQNLIDKFFEKGNLLEKFPELGRKVPEFNRVEIRELIFKNYRMIYKRINHSTIHIVAIHNSIFPLSEKSVFE